MGMPMLDLPSCELPAIKELTEYQQWVCWQSVIRNGSKPTKVPISPLSIKPASTTDKNTWGSYSQAAQAFVSAENVDGIGFVLSEHDPFVGIDLDNCRNPDTGELTPGATTIALNIDSYTEVSPSGKGVHIFVRGTIPERGRRSGNVEIYSSARYLTVTVPKRESASNAKLIEFDLDREPPADKFAALLLNSKKFTHTWEHKRTDLSAQVFYTLEQDMNRFASY